ncbi:2OG-Fe(II) oxygenase [Nonomuraea angiospora]|uniref:2OG-Fe(II) oxygenase n=1 Tax=Nonomuraea angiospora TaxID=46172 RepID=UPI00344DC11F
MSSAKLTEELTEETTAELAREVTMDWAKLAEEVNSYGCALTPPVLTPEECKEIAGLYDEVGLFRSTIDMERHRFGAGQYRYFSRPFPPLVEKLRAAFYPRLLPIARDWAARLGQPAPWPDDFDEWLDMCHRAGQTRPTPILLRYKRDDWNALHRDLYGDLVFPLQVVIGLDRPGEDYTGGEFLLVEQRPRAQSRGTVTLLPQGHGLIFTTRDRPVRSSRGWSASPVRHGVSTVRSGLRHTLGLVFHDAK